MPRQISGKKYTDQFSIRLPEGLRDFIEKDIAENQEHLNRNEWMIRAVEHYKEYRLEQILRTKQAANMPISETAQENIKKSGRA